MTALRNDGFFSAMGKVFTPARELVRPHGPAAGPGIAGGLKE